jgi:hypothetical protein
VLRRATTLCLVVHWPACQPLMSPCKICEQFSSAPWRCYRMPVPVILLAALPHSVQGRTLFLSEMRYPRQIIVKRCLYVVSIANNHMST